MQIHHPSIAKRFEKHNYKKGGKVEYYAGGGQSTDTVPAMLTPGEVVLNEKQQVALENITGQKREALFKAAKVPGFKGGGLVNKNKHY